MIRPPLSFRREGEMPLGTTVVVKGSRPPVRGTFTLYRTSGDRRLCWITTEQGELLGAYAESQLAPLN